MANVAKNILYVIKVHLNAIHQEIILAAMKNNNCVEKPKISAFARDVLIIEGSIKRRNVRFQR